MLQPWQQNVMVTCKELENSELTISEFSRSRGISRRHLTRLILINKWIRHPAVDMCKTVATAYLMARKKESDHQKLTLERKLYKAQQRMESIDD